MKKKNLAVFLLSAAMAIQGVMPAWAAPAKTDQGVTEKVETIAKTEETAGRSIENISAGWKYQLGNKTDTPGQTAFDDSSWQQVDVPHTWNDQDAQDGGNNYRKDVGWYRKEITWKPEYQGKQIFIQFLGANVMTQVFINGQSVGTHKGGYTAFRFDITDKLKTGSNVIAVKVDNRDQQDTAPLSGDFNFYGGIYREVSLIFAAPVHVDLMDSGSSGLYLTTKNVSKSSAGLEVRARIVNESNQPKTVSARAILKRPDTFEEIEEVDPEFRPEDMKSNPGIVETMQQQITIPAKGSAEFKQEVTVSSPRLWNGKQDPYRYRVDFEIQDGENLSDCVSEYVGFRFFSVDKNNGFFLNGKSYPLRGVAIHQDWKDMGNAITNDQRETDFGMIYEMGANAVRLAHYPHDSYMYELCDKYGIVAWAEIPFVDVVGSSSDFLEVTKIQLRELIRQQYNRPSICFWGLQNEVRESYNNQMNNTILPALNQLAHAEDPTGRLTTQATNHPTGAAWPSDLMAWNTYQGWYNPGSIGATMDSRRGNSRPIGISEYGAGGNIDQHEDNPARPVTTGQWHPEEYQMSVHEQCIRDISTRNYLWGTFLWNMFDFACDQRNEGDKPGINDKGMVTYDRQDKKDCFYLYKANWNKKDSFAYITGRRFTPRNNNVIPSQKVYSNCDTVEILLNETSLGLMQNTGNGIFEKKNLTLKAGENKIRVIGTKAGKTYTDTITIERSMGSTAQLASSVLSVSNTAKTIGLTKSVTIEELSEILTGVNGAVYRIVEADGATEVTKGEVRPGMKAIVTAEDGKNTAEYTFMALHINANKPVTASSIQTGNEAFKAVDLDDTTRWAANAVGGGQWIRVDLKDRYTLGQIRVDWYNSAVRSYQYRIEVSDNDKDWTSVIDRTKNTQDGSVSDTFPKGTAGRYVRIYVTGCSMSTAQASIFEWMITGWKLDSEIYEVDHENHIIKVPKPASLLMNEHFLENLDIQGNCSYTLDAVSYFISSGDRIIFTDDAGNEVSYLIELRDDMPVNSPVISRNKPVTCSGEEGISSTGENTYAKNINDGDAQTRWAAPKYDINGNPSEEGTVKYPEWVMMDLGRNYDISKIDLLLYQSGSRFYGYEIWGGTKDTELTKLIDQSANTDPNGPFTHEMTEKVKARYIKIVVSKCSLDAKWAGASIMEMTVYGDLSPAKEILDRAKEGAEAALAGLAVSNATTQEDILTAVTEAIANEQVHVSWGKAFQKAEADTMREGSITGELWLEYDSENVTVQVAKTIAKLPEEKPDPAEILKGAKEKAETALSGLAVSNATVADDILNAVKAVIGDAKIHAAWSKEFRKVVATVEREGTVTGEICLTYDSGSTFIQIERKISKLPVSAPADKQTPTIKLNQTNILLAVKQTTTCVTIKHSSVKGEKIVSASSSNSQIAQVNVKKGKLHIKGIKKGSAVVTVTTTNGGEAKVRVKVQKGKVVTTKLTLDKKKCVLKRGKKLTLKVSRKPVTSIEKLRWSSSDKNVAVVNAKGVVRAKKKGKATILVKAPNGRKAKCIVTVK